MKKRDMPPTVVIPKPALVGLQATYVNAQRAQQELTDLIRWTFQQVAPNGANIADYELNIMVGEFKVVQPPTTNKEEESK